MPAICSLRVDEHPAPEPELVRKFAREVFNMFWWALQNTYTHDAGQPADVLSFVDEYALYMLGSGSIRRQPVKRADVIVVEIVKVQEEDVRLLVSIYLLPFEHS